MIFVVTDDCLLLGLRAGAILFRGLRVAAASAELRAAIARETEDLQRRIPTAALIRALPEVVGFEELIRKVGVNPRKLPPSVARLLAFALQRGALPAINTLVDAYNLVSMRSLLSLGAHDLDAIALPVTLRLLTGAEPFTPLGKSSPEAVRAGEFGYVDGKGRVLCRLDVLQAEFSKVTTETANALLIIEGTPVHSPDSFRRAFADAIETVTRYCGGIAEVVGIPRE
jgi:DNA/RNA-binding domain of Phe-tRNA-synthetase-like protein